MFIFVFFFCPARLLWGVLTVASEVLGANHPQTLHCQAALERLQENTAQ